MKLATTFTKMNLLRSTCSGLSGPDLTFPTELAVCAEFLGCVVTAPMMAGSRSTQTHDAVVRRLLLCLSLPRMLQPRIMRLRTVSRSTKWCFRAAATWTITITISVVAA